MHGDDKTEKGALDHAKDTVRKAVGDAEEAVWETFYEAKDLVEDAGEGLAHPLGHQRHPAETEHKAD